MSKVKSSGKVAQQAQSKRKGKHFGLKKSGGQTVKSGNIIIRQKGAKYKAGKGVGMGGDYTIYATTDGIVQFGIKRGKTLVSVTTNLV